MQEKQVLSSFPRLLMFASAAAFAVMGLVLFTAPAWSAANFSWKISPLVAMTMGGWYLGSAVMAGLVAYHRRWSLVYSSILYIGIFSLSEALVLVIHRANLRLDALLAWPYIGMLALAMLASLLALLDWLRQKPALIDEGHPVSTWERFVMLAFIVFVFFLSVVALSGNRAGLNGAIFPEPLSLFTLRSFGAFYFSLACSVIPLLRAKSLAAVTVQVRGGLALILFITAAALICFNVFNLPAHPFQSIYLGVYLAALALAIFYLWSERSA